MDNGEVLKIVKQSVAEYLESMDQSHEVDEQFQLFGKNAVLDSMGLVNVIIDIESRFLDNGHEISLISEKAMSQKNSPFSTIASLSDFICKQLS